MMPRTFRLRIADCGLRIERGQSAVRIVDCGVKGKEMGKSAGVGQVRRVGFIRARQNREILVSWPTRRIREMGAILYAVEARPRF